MKGCVTTRFSYTFLTTSIFAIALVWILSYLRKTDGDHLRKNADIECLSLICYKKDLFSYFVKV